MLSKDTRKRQAPDRIGLFKSLLIALDVPHFILFMNNYRPEVQALYYDFTTLEHIDVFTKCILGNRLDKLDYLLNHEFTTVSEITLVELILISIRVSNQDAFFKLLNFAIRHDDSSILTILIKVAKVLSLHSLPIDSFINKEIEYHHSLQQLPLKKILSVDDKWFYFKTVIRHIEGFVVARINKKPSAWMSGIIAQNRVYEGNLTHISTAENEVLMDVDIDKLQSKITLVSAVAQFIRRSDLKHLIKLFHESLFRTVFLYDGVSILSAILADRTLLKYKAFICLFAPFYQNSMTRLDLSMLLNLHAMPRPLDEKSCVDYWQMIELVFQASIESYADITVDKHLKTVFDQLVLEPKQIKLTFAPLSRDMYLDEKSQYVRLFTQIATYPGFEKAAYLILREPLVLSSLETHSVTQILNYAFRNKLPKLINVFAYFKLFHFDPSILLNGKYPANEVLTHLLSVFDKLSYEALILYLPLLEEEQAKPYKADLFDNKDISQSVQAYGSVEDFSRFWSKLVARLELCLTIVKPKTFIPAKSCLTDKSKREATVRIRASHVDQDIHEQPAQSQAEVLGVLRKKVKFQIET